MSFQTNPTQSQSHFRPANQNSRGLAGLGLSPMKMFDNDRTLPMYKDKPFAPRRTAPRRGLKRMLGVFGICTLALLWWFFYRSDLPSWQGVDSNDVGFELWKWSQTLDNAPAKGPVDWTSRREKVREAFMVSWDGYEKEAWGKRHRTNLSATQLTRSLRI